MYTTLFEYDTEIFADSVEVVPNSSNGLFVSGTYQLDKQTRQRNGRIELHQFHSDSNSISTYSNVNVPGILDMKFNPEQMGSNHDLIVALSDGTLTMIGLDMSDLSKNSLETKQKLLIDNESTICLSVDWSNQINSSSDPQIAVSLSNGKMSLCGNRDGSLEVLHLWKAHTLPYVNTPAEVWITSFDPKDNNCVLSGGDDSLMKQWDIRTLTKPILVNSEAEAGVTSMCWNKWNSDYLTVGSYDGHIRIYDRRSLSRCVESISLGEDAGIWRIKYKQNSNYYQSLSKGLSYVSSSDECVIAAMRAGFVVMTISATGEMKQEVQYLKQGTETLAYGVDYIINEGNEEEKKKGVIGSCSFYNHCMHVWDYQY